MVVRWDGCVKESLSTLSLNSATTNMSDGTCQGSSLLGPIFRGLQNVFATNVVNALLHDHKVMDLRHYSIVGVA